MYTKVAAPLVAAPIAALAYTGFNYSKVVILGLMLVILGVGFLYASRKKRSRSRFLGH
jgi:LPXTG-motif cell wall-anchored protein